MRGTYIFTEKQYRATEIGDGYITRGLKGVPMQLSGT